MDLGDFDFIKPQETFSIKPLEVEDAPLLISSRIFGGTRKDVKLRIAAMIKSSGKGNAYLLQESDPNNGMILCGFSAVDPAANQATLWIQQADTGLVFEKPAFSYMSKAMSFLLYEGFHRRKYHKLNLCVKGSDIRMIEMLDFYQWEKEGVFRDYFYTEGRYDAAIQYAMFENEFALYSTSLVPFLSGYLAVQATNDAVFGISILKAGESVPEFIAKNEEIKNRISTENKIKKPVDPQQVFSSAKAYPYLLYASGQLFEYTAGDRTQFELSYEFSGATDFQKQVWDATMQVPFGQTRTYEEIARKLIPKDKNSDLRLLSRAVGTALGRNAIMIAIPCHRIIGKDGKLKGFAGGLEVKDYLLSHEMLSLK